MGIRIRLTKDNVTSWLIELNYSLLEHHFAIRYDVYSRFDKDTVNATIPTSFLGYSGLGNTILETYQSVSFAYRYVLSEYLAFDAEIFTENDDVLGGLSYLTVHF